MLRLIAANAARHLSLISLFVALVALVLALSSCSDTTVLIPKKNNNDANCEGAACDSCEDVTCSGSEVCYRGVCHSSCFGDSECPAEQICEQNRCVAPDCSLTPCRGGEVCFRGVCHESCLESTECFGEQICRDGRCQDDEGEACGIDTPCNDGGDCVAGLCVDPLCDNVQCANGESCNRGTCYGVCTDTSECPADTRCHRGRCTPFDCDQVSCRADETCSQGICFPSCVNNAQCPGGTSCRNNLCVGDKCDNVSCDANTNCYEGHCFDGCESDAQCAGNERCYLARRVCVPLDCSGDYCEASDVCDKGVCYQGCLDDADCSQGKRCEQDVCVDPACETKFCPQGEQCYRGDCLVSGCPDRVTCPAGTRCHEPWKLCTPTDCNAVKCYQDEVCDPATGTCPLKCDADADCPQGSACNLAKGFCDDSCAQITCDAGLICANGDCRKQCERTSDCPNDSYCHHDGVCLPFNCSGVACTPSRPLCEDGTCRMCRDVDRVSGWSQDPSLRRYYTAASFALKLYDNGADTAILALGRVSSLDVSPDAITAGPLAHARQAPILLTEFTRVPPVTENALKRLGVKNVIIVGGVLAVSETVATKLRGDGYNVVRYGGQEREDTAALIAEAMNPTTSIAFIISADNQHMLSAITIGGVASAMRAPILLVHRDTIPAVTARLLTQFNIRDTVVLGNTSMISDAVLAGLPNPTRISQTAGFALSAAVAKYAIDNGPNLTQINLASIDSLNDALVSGASGRILLITGSNSLHSEADAFLREHATEALLIGDLHALSKKVEDEVCTALSSPRQ